jgi:hypothetical protein
MRPEKFATPDGSGLTTREKKMKFREGSEAVSLVKKVTVFEIFASCEPEDRSS